MLALWRLFTGVSSAVKVGLIAGMLGLTWWGASKASSAVSEFFRPTITVTQCKEATELAALKSLLESKDAALAKAQTTLADRNADNEEAAAEIARLEVQAHEARQKLLDPDAPVFTASDPWLRERSR